MHLRLGQNLDLILNLANAKGDKKAKKTSVRNVLMSLRLYVIQSFWPFPYLILRVRCLQHPYLVDRNLESAGLSAKVVHQHLVDASAKLRLLRVMLPKLKARGHRVLFFSQVTE